MGSQIFDVGATLSAAGEHQQQVNQDLATVMERHPLGAADDGAGQRITEADVIREGAQSVEAGVTGDLVPARFHHDPGCAGSVHLRSALSLGWLCCCKRQFPLQEGTFVTSPLRHHRST